MTRVKQFSSMALALMGMTAILSPGVASVYDDARKICLERYNEESAGHSVPAGMSKATYLRQCQGSYVKTAAREQSYEKSGEGDLKPTVKGKNGQGGPEILPPGTFNLKPALKKATVPAPRFKPTI